MFSNLNIIGTVTSRKTSADRLQLVAQGTSQEVTASVLVFYGSSIAWLEYPRSKRRTFLNAERKKIPMRGAFRSQFDRRTPILFLFPDDCFPALLNYYPMLTQNRLSSFRVFENPWNHLIYVSFFFFFEHGATHS